MVDLDRASEVAGVSAAGGILRIHVLGELDIQQDGAVVRPVSSVRAKSLLAFLVCHADQSHSRQRLAFMLWPDSNESQARTNLRNVLHVLRAAVPATERYIEATAGTLRWRQDPSCWIDVVVFRGAAERAELADEGSDPELAALQEAAGCYRGDLLEDCYDDWAVAERERLRDTVLSVLRRLAEVLSDRVRHDAAIRAGREVTRRDRFDEAGYRLRMRVHAAAGDRTGAMRVYHECVAVLRQELGVEPSPATQSACADLTRSGEPELRGRRHGSTFDLVGRTNELAQLKTIWSEAEQGRSQLMLLTGEPGVGKTRLAEQLAGWIAHRGGTVCNARAYPAEGDLGFGVVASWLRHPDVMARLRRLGATALAELARVLPELGEPRRVASGTAEQEDRLRLFDAMVSALTSGGDPVLLVLDDAQWSDAPSLEFVHYLLRKSPNSPLLVLATVRREELDPNHRLQAIVNELGIADKAMDIAVQRLNRTETIELAEAVIGTALDDSGADALYNDTEGNPLFVVETLRARNDGSGHVSMTPKLRAVIDARLGRLGNDARDVLGVAATVGRSFTPVLVGCAAELDEQQLVQALDELWRRGFIREYDVDAYDFSHGRIRDAAYDALSPASRRRNHLRIARALIELSPDSATVSGQIAVNMDRAGASDEAVDWYERAARHALMRSAYGEAVRFLDRGHELTQTVAEPSGRCRELAVLTMLSTAVAAADSYASPRQHAVLARATELAAMLRVELDPTLLRARVMNSLCRNEFDEARTAAARLAESASRLNDIGLAVESQYLLGIGAFWACDLVSAREHFESVIDRFESTDRVEHALRFGHDPRIVCTSRLANTLWFLGHTDDALAARERATGLSVDMPESYSANVAKLFAAVLAVEIGQTDDIRACAAALDRDGERSSMFDITDEVFKGYVEALDGRVEGLARIRRAVDELGASSPAPGAISTLTRVLVGAHELVGDPSEGRAAAELALRLEGSRVWEPELRRLRSMFLARSGAPVSDVRTELDNASRVAGAHMQAGPARVIATTRLQLIPT